MRILLVHNHYSSKFPSGENRVFALERDLLSRQGHDVLTFERHSDDLIGVGGAVHGALSTIWNPIAAEKLQGVVKSFCPDVVHVHNTFPLVSDSIFRALKGPARVLTLHNYRLFCASAIPMRDGRSCTECIDRRSVLPAIRHRCYRSSAVATLPLAAKIGIHRSARTWEREVEAFIALTPFQRNKVVAAGLPEEKVFVKPHFVPGMPVVMPFDERLDQVVYVGRLGEEKGVKTLVEAWLKWGAAAPELVIVGDGALRSTLERNVELHGARNVSFVGSVKPEVVVTFIQSSKLLVLPSVLYETFGLAVVEAMSHATPAVVSDMGSLPDLVRGGSGEVFRAHDSDDLLDVVKRLWSDPERLKQMSAAARDAFLAQYTDSENYRVLMDVYGQAISRRSFEKKVKQ